MKIKMTIRIAPELYILLKNECKRYGYRSLSAYAEKLLRERQVFEISGGDELASAIHQVKTLSVNDLWLRERREQLCQSYDSLTTEIRKLRNYVESCSMRHEMEQ